MEPPIDIATYGLANSTAARLWTIADAVLTLCDKDQTRARKLADLIKSEPQKALEFIRDIQQQVSDEFLTIKTDLAAECERRKVAPRLYNPDELEAQAAGQPVPTVEGGA